MPSKCTFSDKVDLGNAREKRLDEAIIFKKTQTNKQSPNI